MKLIKFLLVGIAFGIVLTKSEIISWFRLQELFRLDSFYLVKILASGIAFGSLGVFLMKKMKLKDINGQPIVFKDKDKGYKRYVAGGVLFGLGWSMAGCPGAQYTLIGHGQYSFVIILLSALLGTWLYGLIRERLPH